MKIQTVLLFFSLLATSLSCNEEEPDESFVMTVRGPVSVEHTGQWLSHEHVMVDWIGADSTGSHRWDKDSVLLRVLPFVEEIKQLGVTSFADCSPAFLGRDPVLLKELSEKADIHILTNTGYYGAVDNLFIPDFAWEETAGEIAARWIDEYVNGIEDSGVKPGFIKIGVKEEGSLSDLHRKLITAAAITHKETGLPVKSHTGGDTPAFEQIEILQQEGVSASAFMWTHSQNGSLDKQIEAAGKGAWISLDGVNISSDDNGSGNGPWYTNRLKELRDAGVLNQVLLSHDAGWYNVGEENGGYFRAYSDIHKYLIPGLLEDGFTREEINLLISENPSRAFEIRVRPFVE